MTRILTAALVGAIGLVTGLTLVALSPVLAQDEMATVSMGDNFFEPFELTVAPGTTITWVNDGADLHDVVSDWFIFDSGLMSPGDSFSWVFSDVGDYAYVCDLHDDMNGVVHVTGAVAPDAPQPTARPAPTTPPAAPTAAPPAATAPPPPPAAAGRAAVTIQNFTFQPGTVTVSVGSTVTWTNQDGVPHTASGPGFDTGNLRQGQAGSATFSSPGRFDYQCNIHPTIKGVVIVSG